MPNPFSTCTECLQNEDIFELLKSLGKVKSHAGCKAYNNFLKIQDIFISHGIPKEIAQKIIKLSQSYEKCDYCKKTKLCKAHYKNAIKNGKHYRGPFAGAMCSDCCWNEVG